VHDRGARLLCVQWNYIDFLVVVGGYVSMIPGVGNISALRIVRVLRPLRTLNRLVGLRVIVLTLLHSLRSLGHVALLILFLFTVYAIVGVQVRRCGTAARVRGSGCGVVWDGVMSCVIGCVSLQMFKGALRRRCYDVTAPTNDDLINGFCSSSSFGATCADGFVCTHGGCVCVLRCARPPLNRVAAASRSGAV
jgi:hypothetical protein